MKIKNREDKFNPYYGNMGGRCTFTFKKSEEIAALKKIAVFLQGLKTKYNGLDVSWDLDLYQNKAYVHWEREYTKEEAAKARKAKKEDEVARKTEEFKQVKKLAKKYKLI